MLFVAIQLWLAPVLLLQVISAQLPARITAWQFPAFPMEILIIIMSDVKTNMEIQIQMIFMLRLLLPIHHHLVVHLAAEAAVAPSLHQKLTRMVASHIFVTDTVAERTASSVTITWVNPEDARFEKTVVIKSTEAVDPYITYSAMIELGEVVYEGEGTNFIDTEVDEYSDYFYVIFTVDKYNNSSDALLIEKKSGVAKSTETGTGSSGGQSTASAGNGDYSGLKTLAGVSGDVVDKVSRSDAQVVFYYNQRVGLNDTTNRLYLFYFNQEPPQS